VVDVSANPNQWPGVAGPTALLTWPRPYSPGWGSRKWPVCADMIRWVQPLGFGRRSTGSMANMDSVNPRCSDQRQRYRFLGKQLRRCKCNGTSIRSWSPVEYQWRPSDMAFATVLGTRIGPSSSYHRPKRLLSAADLPRCGFHAHRHSCASLLLAAGLPMQSIMEQLGHSQVILTSDLYWHVAPTMPSVNADALERARSGRW